MKIALLCGCLEPGKDGVGDYVRKLAGHLVLWQHEVILIALNDSFIEDKVTGFQDEEGVKISVFRIPYSWSVSAKKPLVKRILRAFGPDWLSLQFVPFTYDSKGLPFWLNNFLTGLGTEIQWHIMFHELWVGMKKGSPLKHIIWGWLQKRIIQSLIGNLKPVVIHSQAALYQQYLQKLHYNVALLPLFPNIPLLAKSASQDEQNRVLSLVHFGTIHREAPVERFAAEVLRYQKEKNVKVVLTFVGRVGTEEHRWRSLWEKAGLSIDVLGELSPARISETLSEAAFGISTNPIALIDKSGTVAAMLEHNLPVLSVSQLWIPRGLSHPAPKQGIFKLEKGCIDTCLKAKGQLFAIPKAFDVAKQFIEALNGHSVVEKAQPIV